MYLEGLRRYERQIVAVTGGARGIGKNIVRAFAREGARVLVCDNDEDRGHNTALELRMGHLAVDFLPVDIGRKGQERALIQRIADSYGRLDVLINNARPVYPDVVDAGDPGVDEDAWESVMSTTLRFAYFASQAALGLMKNNGGAIVNISSTAGLVAAHGAPPVYQIASAGMIQMTRYFAVLGGPDRVRVNAVLPGLIVEDEDRTRFEHRDSVHSRETAAFCHPAGRAGSSDDVANACLFLCAYNSAFITGQCIVVDGGLGIQEPYSLVMESEQRTERSKL